LLREKSDHEDWNFIHADLEGRHISACRRRLAEPAECKRVTGSYVKGESKVKKS
jgi:hypothetical protein